MLRMNIFSELDQLEKILKIIQKSSFYLLVHRHLVLVLRNISNQ